MGKKLTTEEVFTRLESNNPHNYMFHYVFYKNINSKVIAVCNTHGEFLMQLSTLLKGALCPFCNKERLKTLRTETTSSFINRSNNVHDYFYLYDKTIYTDSHEKVTIICPIHGDFEQLPINHLKGHKCLYCSRSKRSKKESDLCDFLKSITEVSQTQKPKWLGKRELDVFIPSLKLAVEYNGTVYHHSSKGISQWLNNTAKSDTYHLEKYELCKQNGINLIHIFEFEDMEQWKIKLKLLIQNPNKYSIGFENIERNLKYGENKLKFYGKSFIKISDCTK